MLNLLRLCRKDKISFDFVVAVFGNKVECCIDNVAGVDRACQSICARDAHMHVNVMNRKYVTDTCEAAKETSIWKQMLLPQ